MDEFNITLFDSIVASALNPSSSNYKQSSAILLSFKEDPQNHQHIINILTKSSNPESHFIALQILEQVIKTVWNTFDDVKKGAIRNFIIQEINSRVVYDQVLLEKFNICLVEILKRDWPKKWPNFIQDIVSAGNLGGVNVCANSLDILRRLNDEIFIFSDITTVRKRQLIMQMRREFYLIYNFINGLLESSREIKPGETLMSAVFKALQSFSAYMPLSFICETNIMENMCFYINSDYSLPALKCVKKIVELRNDNENSLREAESLEVYTRFEMKIVMVHNECIKFITLYFTKFKDKKMHDVYKIMQREEKDFIYVVASLLCVFYYKLALLEETSINLINDGMRFLIAIAKVDEEKILKEIIDTWQGFTKNLYADCPYARGDRDTHIHISGQTNVSSVLRKDKYEAVLKSITDFMILKMPRPEEVFITENEYGEIIRARVTESDQIEFYRAMKNTFFYLSFLNKKYVIDTINSKISKMYDASFFSWERLNTVCWATGCMAGALDIDEESNLFVVILKELLSLCEVKYDKSDKAVIASNIMFLIGQFERFLYTHGRFLITVAKKCFEFMREDHQGVKDMATETFLKISTKCSKMFVTQLEDNDNFVYYILKNLKEATCRLEYYQKRIVYEACSILIAQSFGKFKPAYIKIFVDNFSCDVSQLRSRDDLTRTCHSLRSYTIMFSSVPESIELSIDFFNSLLIKFDEIILLRDQTSCILKDEIITLFTSVIKQAAFVQISSELVQILFDRVICHFQSYPSGHLLTLATEIARNLPTLNALQRDSFFITQIFTPLNNCDILNSDFKCEYFSLLLVLFQHSFDSFGNILQTNDVIYKSVIQNVMNAIGDGKECNELSLEIITVLIDKMLHAKNYTFFKSYMLLFIENLLAIVFDKDMSFSFDKQCELLASIFKSLKQPGMVRLSLNEENTAFVYNHLFCLFTSNYNNLMHENLDLFITSLFDLCHDVKVFEEHIKDFGVRLYEFSCFDEFEEERALAIERKNEVYSKMNN